MSHTHEHGPGCTCGCEHGHDPSKAPELSWAQAALERHMHDAAATVSITLCPEPGCQVGFSSLACAMERIAQKAESSGVVVGHIKAFARQGDAFARASVVASDLPAALEGEPGLLIVQGTQVELVAIVLLMDCDELSSICCAALSAV